MITAAERIDSGALRRYLSQPRRMADIAPFVETLAGTKYDPKTIQRRMVDIGAHQVDRNGQPRERGKFWQYTNNTEEIDQ